MVFFSTFSYVHWWLNNVRQTMEVNLERVKNKWCFPFSKRKFTKRRTKHRKTEGTANITSRYTECVTNGNFSRTKWRHHYSYSLALSHSASIGRLPFVTLFRSNAHLTVHFIRHHLMKAIQMCVLGVCGDFFFLSFGWMMPSLPCWRWLALCSCCCYVVMICYGWCVTSSISRLHSVNAYTLIIIFVAIWSFKHFD